MIYLRDNHHFMCGFYKRNVEIKVFDFYTLFIKEYSIIDFENRLKNIYFCCTERPAAGANFRGLWKIHKSFIYLFLIRLFFEKITLLRSSSYFERPKMQFYE
eukprot:UN05351